MLNEILEALKETYENVGEEETYIDCIYFLYFHQPVILAPHCLDTSFGV